MYLKLDSICQLTFAKPLTMEYELRNYAILRSILQVRRIAYTFDVIITFMKKKLREKIDTYVNRDILPVIHFIRKFFMLSNTISCHLGGKKEQLGKYMF